MPLLSTLGAASARGFRGGTDVGFIEATGGSTADSGDYRYHTFTSDGSFEVTNAPSNKTVDYLLVAGGGGGSTGGGGGGGVLIVSGGSITRGTYPITIGAGGALSGSTATNGEDTTFNGKTAIGGGGGGNTLPGGKNGAAGGCGGGAGATGGAGGAGLQPTSMDGGYGYVGATGGTAGTGGGGGAGATGSGDTGGIGRSGSPLSASTFAAGGDSTHGTPVAGSANTGDGGGGYIDGSTDAGGSGIVVIRYQFQ